MGMVVGVVAGTIVAFIIIAIFKVGKEKPPQFNLKEKRKTVLCLKHGGDYAGQDAFWYCDLCARDQIDPCKCGSAARYFGEALCCTVTCESCDEFVTYVGCDVDVRDEWNKGNRGLWM